jgi:hypothetical protein
MQPDDFEILSEITNIETIAVGPSIREKNILNHLYGKGHWRKRKGFAIIRYKDTFFTVRAEIHWYEAHGKGQVRWKVKKELR